MHFFHVDSDDGPEVVKMNHWNLTDFIGRDLPKNETLLRKPLSLRAIPAKRYFLQLKIYVDSAFQSFFGSDANIIER